MKVLVTGGTNGMGKGVARALAAHEDVDVVILGRSAERGEQTCAELASVGSPERVSFVQCDLSRLADVRTAVAQIRAEHADLDAVFVNAGLGYAPARVETEDGMIEHFQVNYLSQFMLTLNLLDLLEASEHGGRIVFNATELGELSFDDLQLQQSWTFEAAIGLGMVAKHMFYLRLHQLYARRSGPRVSAFGFSIPKTVWTNQVNIIPWGMKLGATIAKWFGQFISIDECGEIIAPLFLADADETSGRSGRFLTSKNGLFVDVGEHPGSSDPDDWEKLWNLSLDLCDDEQTRERAARLL